MTAEGSYPQFTLDDLLARRYRELLGYIAELDRLRSPVVTTVEGHLHRIDLRDIPHHPNVVWNLLDPQAFLTVTRCSVPSFPPCPPELTPWVDYQPNEPTIEPSLKDRVGPDDQPLYWEKDGPQELWEDWFGRWGFWAQEAKVALRVRELHALLYDWHARLQESSEQIEAVAADVSVAYRNIDHPILINSLRIEFDAERSEIVVGCVDEPAQVYGDAIRNLFPSAGDAIAKARKEVQENLDIWAFGGTEVDLFATRFVQTVESSGEFVEGDRPQDRLTARRSRWLLLRLRATGLAELAEGLKAKFEEDGLVPYPIQPVLVDRHVPDEVESEFFGEPDEDEHSYFTKPANAEQLAILRQFAKRGRVHVQGPPGTGKTHTIANLIGHFLAEGKSVLVTSEKAHALSVLREKVVEELQPLCVSLVGSDSGEGLKAGMRGLNEQLGSTELRKLQSEAEKLDQARRKTIHELKLARQKMREIIEREHLPIEVRSWRGSPASAGRYVRERRDLEGWIPGEIQKGSEPPLGQAEFEELLKLLAQYSGEVVPEARKPLPPSLEVPSPEKFRALLEESRLLSQSEPPKPAVPVKDLTIQASEIPAAQGLLREVTEALGRRMSLNSTYLELANRAAETPSVRLAWRELIEQAKVQLDRELQVEQAAAPYHFEIAGDAHSLAEAAKHVLKDVQKKGKRILKPRPFKSQDKILFDSVEARGSFGDEASLKCLIDILEFQEERNQFRAKVRSMAEKAKLPGFDGDDCERQLVRDSALEEALRWETDFYFPIVNRIARTQLGHEEAVKHSPTRLQGRGPTDRMAWWLDAVVRPVLERGLYFYQLQTIRESLRKISEASQAWLDGDPSSPVVRIAKAIEDQNVEDYEAAFADLQELRASAEPVQRRDALLAEIGSRAEEFALRLENGSFETASIRCNLDTAWTYALIDQELRRRSALSLEEAKDELEKLKGQLDRTTVKLASARAWAAQHQRVTQPVRSALSRFHEAQRKVGGGKGKRVPQLLHAMRDAMRDAKDAFPVWIMPLHDLAKSFDFTKTKFDVVIVDEASQLSAVGLITLLIAETAIVVGDDEQTEPNFAGVSFESVSGLIREHLGSFKDQILWAPDASLYSFAGRFGTTVGLREHFRCVPEVISFSSRLCYQGKIQALRESRGVQQVPHVVPVLCSEPILSAHKDVNESEAQEIASLLLACAEMPEYADQTFGIISLRGSADAGGRHPQCDRILQLARGALGPDEWEKFSARAKLKAGVPALFQGDERHVIFLSVGDDPKDRVGPLRLTSEDSIPGQNLKKKMNVAVSRAQNQIWIVHSFQHFETNLQADDIRRRLLEFAYAPKEWLEATQAVNSKAESPFEQAVYADLVRLGFKVTAQVPVGQYHIDLVAEDADAKVAIECDGDAFHQDAAADLSRQLVLERCGWKFVRIRGSEYYRDPERAILRVVEDLEKLGVTPSHAQPEQAEPEGALLSRVRDRASEIRNSLRAGTRITLMPTHRDLPAQPFAEPEDGESEEDLVMPRPDESIFSLPFGHIASRSDLRRPPKPETQKGTGSNASLQLSPYISYTEVGLDDPKFLSEREIQRELVRIIEVEGPVTESTVIERYRVATGYGRFKGPTRELIVNALRKAAQAGLVHSSQDDVSSEIWVYTLPNAPSIRVRQRGPRDLAEIPLNEIVEISRLLLTPHVELSEEESLRSILEILELKRLTEQARQRISRAIELAKLTLSPSYEED